MGQFIESSFTNDAGSRNYKLYVPTGYDGSPLPLIVMLHGCTQDADDFAAGTRMNKVAEKKRCFVVYPEQSTAGNANKCWGWFSASDCTAEQGEASLIAGIVHHVRARFRIDKQRIFIAGMSAGGAMASAMVQAYPGLFAAIGIHSGLPAGIATDLGSALAAMRGAVDIVTPTKTSRPPLSMPVIVFHGERDPTVHVHNGDRIIAQLTTTDATAVVRRKTTPANQADGSGAAGAFTRSVHRDCHDRVVAENWLLHDIRHAWSGGSTKGSYTDANGPDASEEMLRFFLQVTQRRPRSKTLNKRTVRRPRALR